MYNGKVTNSAVELSDPVRRCALIDVVSDSDRDDDLTLPAL